MVKPIGYSSPWEKFENDVYNAVKKYFSNFRPDFRVEWNCNIHDVTPDVVVIGECECGADPQNEPCEIPLLIFEACRMFDFKGRRWNEKDKQMKRYSRICPSILVTPRGYRNRFYCMSSDGKYRILSFQFLHSYFRCLKDNIEVGRKDEMCGSVLCCYVDKANKFFELEVRSRVDRCPDCKSKVHPESLIYCSKYDEHFHPDFLDTEIIKYTLLYTHAECSGCGEHGFNFEECPYSSIKYVHQCNQCGAIFGPDTEKIIMNFEDAHADMMMDFPFYEREFGKRSAEFSKKLGFNSV